MSVERCCMAAALAVAALVSGCAVGPDFKAPAPPEVDRYTREPLRAPTTTFFLSAAMKRGSERAVNEAREADDLPSRTIAGLL